MLPAWYALPDCTSPWSYDGMGHISACMVCCALLHCTSLRSYTDQKHNAMSMAPCALLRCTSPGSEYGLVSLYSVAYKDIQGSYNRKVFNFPDFPQKTKHISLTFLVSFICFSLTVPWNRDIFPWPPDGIYLGKWMLKIMIKNKNRSIFFSGFIKS